MKAILIGYAVCFALFWAGLARLGQWRDRQKALVEKSASFAASPIPEIITGSVVGEGPAHVREIVLPLPKRAELRKSWDEIGKLEPVDDALRGTF